MDGYYAWMIVATALVLMMTTPALALFYGGMSRSKSVLNMMMMSYISLGIVGIVYVLWGWSMAFAGDDVGSLFANPFDAWALKDVPWEQLHRWRDVPDDVRRHHGGAHLGCDRRPRQALGLDPVRAALGHARATSRSPTRCGPPVSGSSPSTSSAQDYAGGTVVHINAGIAGLVLALIIGKRVGFGREPMKPHNLTLTMIGAGLLWFGWYGFNVGSMVFVEADGGELDTAQFMSETGVTFLNTTVATCAAMLGWLLMERILHGKATSLGAASGIVAGLVAITPSCGAVGITGAIAIGAIAGMLCAWAVGLKFKFGMDDSLDVVGVHLVGGLVGTILIGLFSTADAPGGIDGLFYGGGFGSLVDQTAAAGWAILWTGDADHGHRAGDQVHARLAGRRGGRGRGHRLRPARRVGVRPAHQHQQLPVRRGVLAAATVSSAGAATKTEGANA